MEGKNPMIEEMKKSHYRDHPNWQHLVEKCLALEPAQRPPMKTVVKYLELLSESIGACEFTAALRCIIFALYPPAHHPEGSRVQRFRPLSRVATQPCAAAYLYCTR